jgi:hypothetical protein
MEASAKGTIAGAIVGGVAGPCPATASLALQPVAPSASRGEQVRFGAAGPGWSADGKLPRGKISWPVTSRRHGVAIDPSATD